LPSPLQGAPDPRFALQAIWSVQNEAASLRDAKAEAEAGLAEAEAEIDSLLDGKQGEKFESAVSELEAQLRASRETIEGLKLEVGRLEASRFDKNSGWEEKVDRAHAGE